MPNLTDESLMPFGKYKGTKMANVPADYLVWLLNNGCNVGLVADYIRDNLDVLNAEIERKNKSKYQKP